MGRGARSAVVGRRPSTVLMRGLTTVVVVVVVVVAAVGGPAMYAAAILMRISRSTIAVVVVVVVSDCRVVAGAPYPCMRGSARSLPPDISQL